MLNSNDMMTTEEKVPIPQKVTLTIKEAAAFLPLCIFVICFRQPNCPFVLFIGTRRLVKRKELEEYLSRQLAI